MRLCELIYAFNCMKQNDMLRRLLELYPKSFIDEVRVHSLVRYNEFGELLDGHICPLDEETGHTHNGDQ